jgi:hypothetical protein
LRFTVGDIGRNVARTAGCSSAWPASGLAVVHGHPAGVCFGAAIRGCLTLPLPRILGCGDHLPEGALRIDDNTPVYLVPQVPLSPRVGSRMAWVMVRRATLRQEVAALSAALPALRRLMDLAAESPDGPASAAPTQTPPGETSRSRSPSTGPRPKTRRKRHPEPPPSSKGQQHRAAAYQSGAAGPRCVILKSHRRLRRARE